MQRFHPPRPPGSHKVVIPAMSKPLQRNVPPTAPPARVAHSDPPAPAPAAAARRRLQVCQRFMTQSGHHIRWDARLRQFGAQCAHPSHNSGGSRCKVDRAAAKGPLGHLLAWLEHAPACATREEHQRLKSSDTELSWERRNALRQWASEQWPEAIAFETDARDGETSEPAALTR